MNSIVYDGYITEQVFIVIHGVHKPTNITGAPPYMLNYQRVHDPLLTYNSSPHCPRGRKWPSLPCLTRGFFRVDKGLMNSWVRTDIHGTSWDDYGIIVGNDVCWENCKRSPSTLRGGYQKLGGRWMTIEPSLNHDGVLGVIARNMFEPFNLGVSEKHAHSIWAFF